jgi:hypothetical protein
VSDKQAATLERRRVHTPELFLIVMTIIFTVSYLIWRIGRTEYYAPLVVLQISTVILFGPGILGAALPDYYHFVFTKDVVGALNGFVWWAVMVPAMISGVLLVVSVFGKFLGLSMAGRVLGWQAGESSLIGWLLQTKALIMIIFANVLVDKHIITSETLTALLLMAVASTMLTVPVVAPRLGKLSGLIARAS